jgi:hypothetical protein
MPLYHPRNLYRGVNAHFQSYCQAESDWESFHTSFIVHLANLINEALPTNYVVKPEAGLQIREFDLLSGENLWHRRKSDLSIFPSPPLYIEAALAGPYEAHASATLNLKALETLSLEPEAYLHSLRIYEIQGERGLGRPVAHIELLSASNKRRGGAYENYRDKRRELMGSGIHLVEIDLLHESDSPILGLPSYPTGDDKSYPYYIALSPAQAHLSEVITAIYGFGIDEIIPLIYVPLLKEEGFRLDCQTAYDLAFANNRLFSQVVDYAAPPAHFDRYHPADQAKIRALMNRVAADSPS